MQNKLSATKPRSCRPWTSEEETFFRENHAKMSFDEMGRALGRSASAIRTQGLKLGLREAQRKVARWSKRDLHTLYLLSESLTIPLIAEKMGRSIPSVKSKMIDEGISPLNGRVSVKQFARDTGYAVYQIMRAVRALKIHLDKVRSRTHGQYVLTDETCEKIVEYLATEQRVRLPVEQKFFAKVVKTPTCWLWNGGERFFDAHTGKDHSPPRIAWLLSKGRLDKSERLYRRCETKGCCNPEHFWIGVVGGSKMSPAKRREILRERIA